MMIPGYLPLPRRGEYQQMMRIEVEGNGVVAEIERKRGKVCFRFGVYVEEWRPEFSKRKRARALKAVEQNP